MLGTCRNGIVFVFTKKCCTSILLYVIPHGLINNIDMTIHFWNFTCYVGYIKVDHFLYILSNVKQKINEFITIKSIWCRFKENLVILRFTMGIELWRHKESTYLYNIVESFEMETRVLPPSPVSTIFDFYHNWFAPQGHWLLMRFSSLTLYYLVIVL